MGILYLMGMVARNSGDEYTCTSRLAVSKILEICSVFCDVGRGACLKSLPFKIQSNRVSLVAGVKTHNSNGREDVKEEYRSA